MPHPERAADRLLGSDDGLPILRSLLAAAARAEREPALAVAG
jgi:phosphoribosylformylglycinamidine (FGAM) synthase-like amidotransferase family enzyme